MDKNRIFGFIPSIPRWRPLTVGLFLVVLAASILVLFIPEEQGIAGLNSPIEGQTVPRTLFARVDFETIDFAKTEKAKKEAASSTPDYYILNTAETEHLIQIFRALGDEFRSFNGVVVQSSGRPGALLNIAELRNKFSAENFKYLQMVLSDRAFCREFLSRVENRILKPGIFTTRQASFLSEKRPVYVASGTGDSPLLFGPFKKSDLYTPDRAADEIVSLLLKQYYSDVPEKALAFRTLLTQEFIRLLQNGNVLANVRKTEQAEQEAAEKVTPRLRTFYRGDRLLTKEDKLSDHDIQMLQDYREALLAERQFKSSWSALMQRSALVVVLLLFTVMYIRNVHPHIMEQRRVFLAIIVVTIISLIANQQAGAFFRFLSSETNILPLFIFLCLPLALPSLLLGAVFGYRAAVFSGLYISGVTAIALDNSFPVFISGLLLNGISAFVIRNSSDYKKFFMLSFLTISITNFLLGLIFLLADFSVTADFQLLKDAAALSLLSGLVTPILALVVLFLLETFFDVSSTMSYISLTDRNHPLLKRLQQEAPGTYHHSERVASLAENAAGQIGVNPMLIQACALFHDIGKLANPTLFTENTADNNPNPHAALTPEESVRIIRSHVTYGLELARKYKLKSPLCRGIAQHHGTDFISFFYELAKQNDPEKELSEEDFRYEGPVPLDRETVLLCLADCSEAVARSMPNFTRETLEEKLTAVFQAKLNNGQLDQAPITAAELWKIRDSFVSSLCAMSHVRIAYPSFTSEKKD